ncbi:hypothetical protein N5J77_17310 [Sphingobium yanoikuyae]|nr:hypothetical protein [Sphingobium yanoikuyae]MDH2132890.1 hypothetical protein [Sphingobium yanoikuyae]MDH2149246.1 hypothetical protein [Sphingobium yanoikuyae]MDH2168407.1 hypothetical protein [Sphingobium yanoikuyae]
MVGALFALGTDLVSLVSNLANLMKFVVRNRNPLLSISVWNTLISTFIPAPTRLKRTG